MSFKRHIPNILTLGNLVCGALSITYVLDGHPAWCIMGLIAASLFFDLFDGMVARLLNVSSEIGKQLDSLADLISFGLLPAIMLFAMWTNSSHPLSELPMAYLIPFIYVMAAALRLARFNVQEDTSGDFSGLPSPAAAMSVFGLFIHFNLARAEGIAEYGIPFPLLLGMCLLPSLLMLLELRMFSFKLKSTQIKDLLFPLLTLIGGTVLLILFKFTGLTLAVAWYICLCIIHHLRTSTQ